VAATPVQRETMPDRVALKRITIRGVVQGVGFRPCVYKLAHRHRLTGWVLNHSRGVDIEAEGSPPALAAFVQDLAAQAPPMSRIESIEVADAEVVGYEAFEIRHSVSREESGGETPPLLISPDIATCPDCLAELFDAGDRRYRYPFTNCTNCGPRFTIISDIPYDRPLTTMGKFQMCPLCQAEYDNPLDRRFHAQPNACPVCGPQVWLERFSPSPEEAAGGVVAEKDAAITGAVELLRDGATLAIKGLGGFHLACDATSDEAIDLLRQRKGRPAKPLAVMMSTLDEARQHCLISEDEEQLLTSPQRPIVLLEWKHSSNISQAVAPGNRYMGMMLPYTPLHHVLLRDMGCPLVMTSGNLSEEPIAKDNEEARRRLGHLCDWFLLHDRDIYARYDDSVWYAPDLSGAVEHRKGEPNPARKIPQPIRRSRGYAPFPIKLPFAAREILACGAELKNSFCLTRGDYAFLSQHIGDLENLETLEHFEDSISLYKHLFRIEPQIIAHDLHPEYLATKYARRLGQAGHALVGVQHHHAHIASCLADNSRSQEDGPVIGVAWDGTGLGSDGRIWGGEFFVGDYAGFQRVGHLEYMPMPGGEVAIRKPYRLALGYLLALFGELPIVPTLECVDGAEKSIIRKQVDQSINCPLTSAGGRLFDAVSALIGIRPEASYEAQAAIELEMAASAIQHPYDQRPYPCALELVEGAYVIRLSELFSGLLDDLRDGSSSNIMAARFHRTVSDMIATVCKRVGDEHGVSTVALSGGCFQNRLLLSLVVPRLEQLGFQVLLHSQVPCNDGGLSLGQAVLAHFATS